MINFAKLLIFPDMALEIERKFLVKDNSFVKMAKAVRHIRQTYLSDRPESTVRLRTADGRAWLTVKSKNAGCVRHEWEFEIPEAEAEEMAAQCAGGWRIEKTRYLVDYVGFTWEVDEFHGHHEGLTVAEVELPSADVALELPPFVGIEVTGDPRYYNSNL